MTRFCIRAGLKCAAAALLALGLAGCSSSYDADDASDDGAPVQLASALPQERGQNRVEDQAGQTALQCVPYAREHSQVKLFGDAYTWWDQAAGKYARGGAPETGAVMVLFNYAGPNRGHVAVVRRVVGAREIRIDHANWLDDGSIYVNDPVVDVSANNDWSAIKVWNIKTGGWGVKIYPVQGFIGGQDAMEDLPARAPEDGAALSDARLTQARPGLQPIGMKMPTQRPQPAPSEPDSHALTADDLAIP